MALDNVWIATFGDGLIRADHIVGIESHLTPELTGKPSRWLLDITLEAPAGSGNREGWDIAQLHRTLVQSDSAPVGAPEELARFLYRLAREDAAGVLRADLHAGFLRFDFTPFPEDHLEGTPGQHSAGPGTPS